MFLTKKLTTLVPRFRTEDLFDQADEIERREIDRLFVERKFGFDETIFKEGSVPCIWTIARGSGVLSRRSPCNEPSFSRLVYSGEVLGLTETLARIPFDATLQTFFSCTCQCMDQRSFFELLQRRPRVRQKVLEVLAKNYGKALATAADARRLV